MTVCRPMCGCGATSIGLPSVNVNGPKRSRKHHIGADAVPLIAALLRGQRGRIVDFEVGDAVSGFSHGAEGPARRRE